MSILSRVKISPQQRYDLEDFLAEQSAARTDAKLYAQKFLSEENLILGGFSVSGIGLTQATVAMTGASFIFPQNTSDFSYFISSPTEPDVVIPDSSLVDGARNYVEALLTTQDGTPLTKAFWDPEANSGAGQEFNQIVNTITDLKCSFVVSTGGFSGSPDRLPIAIIDCDGSGVIKIILDRRDLFGRLAKANDLDNEYAWGTKLEPAYSLSMTGVTGTFVAGETITIGGETAIVTTGGTSSIAFNVPTGINFGNGSSVVGGTSGATGSVNTILDSFSGVDKSLKGQKNINDALMTEIKALKGTRFWWETSGNLSKTLKVNYLNPVSTTLPTGASVLIDGSAGVNGDFVLFTNLNTGNNRIYKLSGVGTSIQWTPQPWFTNSSLDPSNSDSVRVTSGSAFADQLAIFNGTNFTVNDVVRYFDGVSGNFWEQSSLKTSTLTDNSTGDIFSVTAAGSENIIVDFSVLRNGVKETGTIWLTNDGTNAFVTQGGAYSGDTGLTFSADIDSGNVRLRYTLTSTGFSASMKYAVRRWSDSAGGPTGIPSYSGGGGGGGTAGGSNTQLQYNNSGILAGDPKFAVDTADGSLNLNGLRQNALSSGVTLLNNQVSPATAFTYLASFKFAVIEYSIVRNGAYRTGNLLIANDGSIASINGTSVETAATGITFSASISGANVVVSYTSSNTGFSGTLKYSMRKWS